MSKKLNQFLPLLEDYFVSYLPNSRGMSQNTIISYKQCFLLLLTFLYEKHGKSADEITFNDLTYELLTEYLEWLEKERNCKPVTRNQRLAVLASFSAYAQNRDFEAASVFRLAVNKIPTKKAQMKARAVFTRDEVKTLLSLPDEKHETGLRDKLILSFMYATGTRAQEICDLRVRDIRIDDRSSYVSITGKGSKTRRVGISAKLANTLKKYIRHRKLESDPGKHVFSSQTHEQMTVSCVEGIYKKYIRIAKEQNPDMFHEDSYPPHSMRHTTACHLLEAGVDIVTIKNILGHASLQTTQIYAEMPQDAVDKKLIEWNQNWFGELRQDKSERKNECDRIPQFLKRH